MVATEASWGRGTIRLEHPRFGVGLSVATPDIDGDVAFEMGGGCTDCSGGDSQTAYLDRADRLALILHLVEMDPDITVAVRS